MAPTYVIAQGGGPTAVINQTLAGVVAEAKRRDPKARVLGALHGVRGVRDGHLVDLGALPEAELMRIAATPWPFAVVGTAVVGIVALTGSGIPSSIRVPVLAAFGISALIAWSSLMSRGRRTARLAGYLARRTLAIYVGHAFLLEVLALALLALRQLIPGWDPASGVAMILFVPIVTAALVFATTWLYDRCVPGPLAWLYQPPWRARKAVPV